MENRIFAARRKNAFSGSKIPAILIFSGDFKRQNEDFFYFAGSRVDSCALLLKKGKQPVLFSPKMLYLDAKETGIRTVIYDKKKPYSTILKELRGVRKIGVDYSAISHERFLRLRKGLKGKKLVDCSEQMLSVRMIKEKGEIEKIRKAQRITERIICGVKLSGNKTEKEVADELLKKTALLGCTPAFPPIVATGKGSAGAHHPPTNRKLSGIVMIDYGVKYEGYCGDMTRCFFLGKCREERGVYLKLQKMSREVMGKIRNGMPIRKLDKMHNDLLKKYGLPEPTHLMGHGIGLAVHELPSIHAKAKEKISAGQVFTIEPGAYFPGKFGARFENIVYFDGKRARVL